MKFRRELKTRRNISIRRHSPRFRRIIAKWPLKSDENKSSTVEVMKIQVIGFLSWWNKWSRGAIETFKLWEVAEELGVSRVMNVATVRFNKSKSKGLISWKFLSYLKEKHESNVVQINWYQRFAHWRMKRSCGVDCQRRHIITCSPSAVRSYCHTDRKERTALTRCFTLS